MAGYQVKLPVFEGPFDLLFHLIEEQKLNIYDIPIAGITAQYLEYLHMLECLDIEVAGAFLVMAATLLEIKSRMLLPKVDPLDEERDDGFFSEDEMTGEEARQALVEKLLEYKRFKMTALALRELERKSSRIFCRSLEYEPKPEEVLQLHIGANDLLKLFQGLVRRRLNPPVHRVVVDRMNLNERIREIREFLRFRKGSVNFLDLLSAERNRRELVNSFMAILEMAKNGEIAVAQSKNFHPITVRRVDRCDEDDAPLSAVG
jgi:segregation and condensation protein A